MPDCKSPLEPKPNEKTPINRMKLENIFNEYDLKSIPSSLNSFTLEPNILVERLKELERISKEVEISKLPPGPDVHML
jgi:hypothetical protein